MRIAVTYENGEIYQHFGHTEKFKVYEVQGGKVVSSDIIGSDGQGHGALAVLLSTMNVDVLICGGLGGGAHAVLLQRGIMVCSGASGDADAAVEAYLIGELKDAGVNCDHHGHGEGHSCGVHEEGACSTCGGCTPEPVIEGRNVGKTCFVHYRGTYNDGTEFDSSYGRGEPLEFVCGTGMMIAGFDAAVADMEVGEKKDIHLSPEEAYGPYDPRAVITVQIAQMAGAERLSVGQRVMLQSANGNPVPVTVTAMDDVNITFDANHEMAGKELNFSIELVEVR